jgi:uncharacterized protein (TIGR02246 family)
MRQKSDRKAPMPMTDQLRNFAERYTAAWCSQHPVRVAAFFSPDGSLSVNGAPPAIGRGAITAVAQGFMTDFPDLKITMDGLSVQEDRVIYRWTLAGAHTGPGGTEKRVRVSGFEEWRIGPDGLIAESRGHFDEAEYQRQLQPEAPTRPG